MPVIAMNLPYPFQIVRLLEYTEGSGQRCYRFVKGFERSITIDVTCRYNDAYIEHILYLYSPEMGYMLDGINPGC